MFVVVICTCERIRQLIRLTLSPLHMLPCSNLRLSSKLAFVTQINSDYTKDNRKRIADGARWISSAITLLFNTV